MKIIAGFPGIGKTTFANNQRTERGFWNVFDLDSKKWNGTIEFPKNYLDQIEFLLKDSPRHYDYLLVSTHSVVLQGLEDRGIEYILVYPEYELKDEYMKRYHDRGDTTGFIALMDANWVFFNNDLKTANAKQTIVLKPRQYLSDVI